MSRLSFIVALTVLAGCFFVTTCGHDAPLAPVNYGNFLDDFFGSDSDSSTLFPKDERERAALLIKVNHKVPRYTFFTSNFSLTRVPARFCLPTGFGSSEDFSASGSEETYSLEDCEWGEYAESLLLISFVAFIIAVIVFPFLFCGLSLGRCCCCGKWKPTPELCGGDPEDFEVTTNGYTECGVTVLLVVAIGCCIIMAGGAGVGIWGSVVMSRNVDDMANFTNETAHTLADLVDSVVEILRSVSYVQNISDVVSSETLERANNASADLRTLSNNIVIYSDKIDLPRQIFMYFTLVVPFVLMFLVVLNRFLGACPCCCWMPWGMTFLGFFITFLALCTFGFLYPLTSGIADICVFLDEAAEDPDSDTFINSVLSCGPNSTLSAVSDMTNEMFQTAGDSACSVYSMLENVTIPCDTNGDGYVNILDDKCPLVKFQGGEECTFETFSNITRNSKVYNWGIGCFCEEFPGVPGSYYSASGCNPAMHSLWDRTEACPEEVEGKKCYPMYCYANKEDIEVSLEYCSENCTDYGLKSNSTTIMNYTEIAAKVMDLYNNMIKPYLNCESVAEITNRAKDFICINMMNSVTPMYVGEIASAAACFVGTFVAILTTKRFRRAYRKKYAIKGNASSELEHL